MDENKDSQSNSSTGFGFHGQHASMYSLSSYNNIKAGRVCAIIGLVATIPFWGMID
jgi:hypothetical protein